MAYQRKLDKDIRCPLEYGMELFGGKWPGHCFHTAYSGIERFYHRSGENLNQYAQCDYRRCDKYCFGCFIDQWLSDGCPGCALATVISQGVSAFL